jgi:sugar phosphate isomerase/epimerase
MFIFWDELFFNIRKFSHIKKGIMKLTRRQTLKFLSTIPLITLNGNLNQKVHDQTQKDVNPRRPKISLNLYSFNDLLRSGQISLDEVIEFCYQQGYDAIDPTAYYFRGYPEVPDDRYLFEFKYKVFIRGLEISGSGIRNDFSNPEKSARQNDLQRIEGWAEACSKMGIPVLRVFAGHEVNDPDIRKKTWSWMMEDFKKCAEIGEKHGVIMALQNHGEFIKNADEVIQIMETIKSPWFGLHLDIANFSEKDVYQEIQKVIGYAVNWQIKEFVMVNGKRMVPDYSRILEIIRENNYSGYLPLETLGEGDPFEKLKVLKEKVTIAIDNIYS